MAQAWHYVLITPGVYALIKPGLSFDHAKHPALKGVASSHAILRKRKQKA
jgi:hypothetical protein